MAEQKILRMIASGSLAASMQPLYAVNYDIQVEVHQIIIVNKDASDRTVNIYTCMRLSSGGWDAPRLITPANLIMYPSQLTYVLDDPIQMSMSDTIYGSCDLANLVDYTITGIEYPKT